MKSLFRLLFAATVLAVKIVLEDKPDLTTKYHKAASVYSSIRQNRFFNLPNVPSKVFKGFYPIDVQAPLSIDTYVWELSGYYKPKKMGKHRFSIDRTKIASIQIGQKQLKQQAFIDERPDVYVDLLGKDTLFNGCPVTIPLLDNRHYYVKIRYIAGIDRVPIYVTGPTGFQQTLDDEITQAVFDPSDKRTHVTEPQKPSKRHPVPAYYDSVGFFSRVYLLPGKQNFDTVIRDFAGAEKVTEGFFKRRAEDLGLPQISAPYIREVLGYFRAPQDGNYRISISGGLAACLQIGPRKIVQDAYYVVDEEWFVVDTRGSSSADVDLDKTFFYPFRVVVIANDPEYQLDISVHDPEGKSVDLFGLWQCPVRPTTLRTSVVKAVPTETPDEYSAVLECPVLTSDKRTQASSNEYTHTLFLEMTTVVKSCSTSAATVTGEKSLEAETKVADTNNTQTVLKNTEPVQTAAAR